MPPEQQNVAKLERHSSGPHPSRVSSIKRWHLDQLDPPDPAVAMIHIAITAEGRVTVKGLGLDHIHAAIVLEELDGVRDQIAAFIDQKPPNNVIPLRA